MYIRRTVGEKGQVVVPKDIRTYLGLKPGSEVVFEVKEKEVIIKPGVDPKTFVEEFGKVPNKLKKIEIRRLEKVLEEEYDLS